jgi:uncharacterized protein
MKSIAPIVLLAIIALARPVVVAQKPTGTEQIQTGVVTVLVSPAEEKEIRQLMDLQGQTPGNPQLAGPLVDQVITNYRKSLTQVPETVWQEVAVGLKTEFPADRFAKSLTPVYASNFTQLEIRELIRFFSSPVGRKWATQLPKIQKGSYDAGYTLGLLMGQRIRERLQAKGYTVPVK